MITSASARTILSKVSSSKRHFVILLLGFSSGLPAALTASTLQAWFTDAGLNLYAIGALSLLVIPYSFRFLWASIFDFVQMPFLDRRRSWLLICQVALLCSIVAMASLTPEQVLTVGGIKIPWLMVIGFLTAFLSSSQDTVINAYQIEILPQEEKGLGAAIYVTGWRIGSILSGAMGLVMASHIGWQETYLLMATVMMIGIFATLFAPAPQTIFTQSAGSVIEAITEPLRDFLKRFGGKATLFFFLLIATYKLGEALALSLNTTFLLRYIGFDLSSVGLVNKTVSVFAALFGGIVAGVLMPRISLYRGLLLFGLMQGLANLSYAAIMWGGKNIWLLVFAAFTENFCSGLGTIALLTLIMSLCNMRFTAAQFALLSAIAFLPRTFVGPLAAWLVENVGWLNFFYGCFLLSLPTLVFVIANRSRIRRT